MSICDWWSVQFSFVFNNYPLGHTCIIAEVRYLMYKTTSHLNERFTDKIHRNPGWKLFGFTGDRDNYQQLAGQSSGNTGILWTAGRGTHLYIYNNEISWHWPLEINALTLFRLSHSCGWQKFVSEWCGFTQIFPSTEFRLRNRMIEMFIRVTSSPLQIDQGMW